MTLSGREEKERRGGGGRRRREEEEEEAKVEDKLLLQSLLKRGKLTSPTITNIISKIAIASSIPSAS